MIKRSEITSQPEKERGRERMKRMNKVNQKEINKGALYNEFVHVTSITQKWCTFTETEIKGMGGVASAKNKNVSWELVAYGMSEEREKKPH